MQDISIKEEPVNTGKILDKLPTEDKQKLVGVFAYPAQEDFDSNQNLIGLFSILLKVDKRINPQNYQNNKKNYDRYSNSSNS